MSAGRLGPSGWAVLAVVYAFVLFPAGVIVVDSFNSATSFPAPFESATVRWYLAMAQRPEFVASMQTSALIATVSAVAASMLAVVAAYALTRYPVPGREAITTFLLGPILVPQIVVGLAILQSASALGAEIGLATLIAAHTVYVLPFALRLALTSLARFDFALEDAAHSLGAGRARTFWHVTLPVIRPGLASGFAFAFILSFVNLPVSLFLASPRTATLPILMFSYMESRIDPLIAAVATVVLAGAVGSTLVLERVFRVRILG